MATYYYKIKYLKSNLKYPRFYNRFGYYALPIFITSGGNRPNQVLQPWLFTPASWPHVNFKVYPENVKFQIEDYDAMAGEQALIWLFIPQNLNLRNFYIEIKDAPNDGQNPEALTTPPFQFFEHFDNQNLDTSKIQVNATYYVITNSYLECYGNPGDSAENFRILSESNGGVIPVNQQNYRIKHRLYGLPDYARQSCIYYEQGLYETKNIALYHEGADSYYARFYSQYSAEGLNFIPLNNQQCVIEVKYDLNFLNVNPNVSAAFIINHNEIRRTENVDISRDVITSDIIYTSCRRTRYDYVIIDQLDQEQEANIEFESLSHPTYKTNNYKVAIISTGNTYSEYSYEYSLINRGFLQNFFPVDLIKSSFQLENLILSPQYNVLDSTSSPSNFDFYFSQDTSQFIVYSPDDAGIEFKNILAQLSIEYLVLSDYILENYNSQIELRNQIKDLYNRVNIEFNLYPAHIQGNKHVYLSDSTTAKILEVFSEKIVLFEGGNKQNVIAYPVAPQFFTLDGTVSSYDFRVIPNINKPLQSKFIYYFLWNFSFKNEQPSDISLPGKSLYDYFLMEYQDEKTVRSELKRYENRNINSFKVVFRK